MYTLFSSFIPQTYNAPVRSTPVMVNGSDCCTRSLGSGGGSGALYGAPEYFLQVTHCLIVLLTRCLMAGIQNI